MYCMSLSTFCTLWAIVLGLTQGPCSSWNTLLCALCCTPLVSLGLYIHLYLNMSVCLSVYPSIYFSFFLSVYLSIYLAFFLNFIYLSICLSSNLSIYKSCYLSIYLSFFLSFYAPLYLSTYLSTYSSKSGPVSSFFAILTWEMRFTPQQPSCWHVFFQRCFAHRTSKSFARLYLLSSIFCPWALSLSLFSSLRFISPFGQKLDFWSSLDIWYFLNIFLSKFEKLGKFWKFRKIPIHSLASCQASYAPLPAVPTRDG